MAWETERLVLELKANARGDVLRVRRCTKAGRVYADVRLWYVGRDGHHHPGKGIVLPSHVIRMVGDALRQL